MVKKKHFFVAVVTLGIPLLFYFSYVIVSSQIIKKVAVGFDYKCTTENKFQCWEEQIDSTLNSHGLDAAFELLANLYAAEPAFAAECHGFVHKLGEAAYNRFSSKQELTLTSKTSYCGYGFYHGFMEALLHSGGNIEQAQEFCAYADAQLRGQTNKTIIACYHGIGHGAVDGSDPRSWGDPDKLIRPGLDICERVSSNEKEKNLCATGVFNALAISYNSGQYQLKDPGDPYEICSRQETNYFKNACYEQMNTYAMAVGGSFFKAALFIKNIKNNDYSGLAMESLASVATSNVTNRIHAELVKVCYSLEERSRVPCIKGLVGGILEYGRPGLEYEEAIEFCQTEVLKDAEREVCFRQLLSSASVLYSIEKVNNICGMVGSYKKYCQ